MFKHRLKLGQHVGFDYTKEPEPVFRNDMQVGIKHPSRTYNAGEIIYDKNNLTQRLGESKFEFLEEVSDSEFEQMNRKGKKTPMKGVKGDQLPFVPDQLRADNPSVSPHGQVTTGFPAALTTEVGPGVRERAMTPEEAADHGATQGSEPTPSSDVEAGVEGQEATATNMPGKSATLESQYGGDFHSLTVSELQEIAEAEEINISGKNKKDDIIKELRKHKKQGK